jgi:predicted peptidase
LAQQKTKVFKTSVEAEYNYLEFLPKNYTTDKTTKFPLVLFLHGSGESGNDINKVKIHGIPKYVETHPDFPAIVISPQCPDARYGWDKDLLKKLIDSCVATLNVDTNRIYITGLSMGGRGTWEMLCYYPEVFAAAVPVCGWGDVRFVRRAKDVPVWIFHGAKDRVVPLIHSVQLLEELQQLNAPVKITVYTDAEHDSWTETYSNPKMYNWLFAQTRGEKTMLHQQISKLNPVTTTLWNGCQRYDFTWNGRAAIIVEPKQALKGNPWVIRPAFFDAFAYADSALVKEGFYVCYYDVTHFYGAPQAQELFSSFYHLAVDSFAFSPKVTLEGFSRGGLFCLNWAVNNPEKVACMYLDAPVCNVNSWPRKFESDRWQELLKVYQTEESKVDALKISPVDKAKEISDTKIPIMIVAGDADKLVPFAENGGLLIKRMKQFGGKVNLILKPGVDHHPHSLTNPKPIVDFIQKYN